MPAIEEDSFNIDASLKNLKAAYRTAIGGGRKNKKGKNKKKEEADESQAVDLAPGNATEAATLAEKSLNREQSEGSIVREPLHVEERVLIPPTDPNVNDTPELKENEDKCHVSHTTKNQSTQQGQSTLTYVTRKALSESRHDYLLSLFADRLAIPYGTLCDSNGPGLVDQRDITDIYGYLVDENSVAHTATTEQSKLKEDDGTPELVKYLVQEGTFKSPSKSPVKTLEEVEKECGETGYAAGTVADDSFVENIISRSPAKPVSRIEDSVEALDQLEDAFDVSRLHK